MLRTIGGVVAGLITWGVVATLLNIGLRHGIPGYTIAEKGLMAATPVMTFTLQMMIARLSISGVSSLVSGYIAALAGNGGSAPLIAGVILLIPFAYVHYTMYWHLFPLWYHLTFLISLPVLSVIGGSLRRG